jgi:hypothetical protein
MSKLFSVDDVRRGLLSLAVELDEAGATTSLSVIGGAAVALQVGREALTQDIDATYPPSDLVAEIVRRIAQRNDWPDDWFNDAAKGFVSHFDTASDWEVLFQIGGVTIVIARPALLLAMKLLAARGARDRNDIEELLRVCTIESAQEAAELFDRYYPTESLNARAHTILQQYFERRAQENS